MHAFATGGSSGSGGSGGGGSSASSSTTGGGGAGSPQLFCLRWNNYQSNLTNVFDQLLQSESFVDVTLACDGHSVKAHKVVLSACSPYFQALFFDNPCRHPIVILKDVRWPELKAAVEFMYKGEINVSQEQIGPLLQVAESLKIRGLADVSGAGDSDDSKADTVSLAPRPAKKRRRDSSPAADSPSASNGLPDALGLVTTSPPAPSSMCPPPPPPPQQQPPPANAASNQMSLAALPPPPPPPQSSASAAAADDMEIKPGIAEMIREEERAKMLESTHASWLGASTSSLAADSYQYQLQSMWQKCWNTNQSLVHHLRFRERGPLKSWRPETMAEAILSVLKEGLSLSQAARKYDIPYPTFVLYANRVHNMLGPSADGGTDLRPKGRGRPQRILLGIWPEDHIHGVIRAVVFRDPQHIKEEAINLGYHRMQEPMYGSPGCNDSSGGAVSPSSAAAAAVVAVAQNLRQQMLAAAHHGAAANAANAAAADAHFNFLAAHCSNGTAGGGGGGIHSPLPSPVNSSPRSSPLSAANPNANAANNSLEQQHVGPPQSPLAAGGHMLSGTSIFPGGIPLSSYKAAAAAAAAASASASANQSQSSLPVFRPEQLFHDEIEDLVKRPQSSETPKVKSPPQAPSTPVSQMQPVIHTGSVPPISNYKPPVSGGGGGGGLTLVRPEYLFHDEIEDLVKRPSSASSEPSKVKVGIGMTYKPTNESYSSNARADALFPEEIDELVKSPSNSSTPNDQQAALPLKVEQRIE